MDIFNAPSMDSVLQQQMSSPRTKHAYALQQKYGIKHEERTREQADKIHTIYSSNDQNLIDAVKGNEEKRQKAKGKRQ